MIKVVNFTTSDIMETTVSATEANRRFSELLRNVREGNSYIVTSHGRPIARISPPEAEQAAPVETKAAFLSRLASQPIVEAGSWQLAA